MPESYPPFDPKGNLYDQSTFWGRYKHFQDVTDLRTLFTTDQQLHKALGLLKAYEEGKLHPPPSNEELWKAKKIKDAIIHPDTGEKILLPFRVSAFLPVNVIICAGLLIPNPSTATTIFWQWINQSYNIALNHANRNASNTMTTNQILESYATAVAVSCTVALGMRRAVDTLFGTASLTLKNTIKMFIPFTAVSVAGVANVYIMRRNEMKEGIQVKDKDGHILGQSPTAGKRAVKQVAISRVATALPALVLPPIVMAGLDRLSFIRNNPKVKIPINLALLSGVFLTSLPAAIALFPQQAEVNVNQLESKFHNLKDKNGNPIEKVYYNKGL